MRLRAGSSLLYPLVVAVTLGTGLMVGAGCGGGSSSDPRSGSTPTPTGPTPTPTATATPASPLTVRSTIIWGDRSRQTTNAVTGPSSALSAIISLRTAGAATDDLTQTVNRDIRGGRQQYVSPTTVRPGVYSLTVRFFAGRDGQGQVVGIAGAQPASVVADITTTDPNDAILSTTIATNGTITKVIVPPGQSLAIGQTKSLDIATATDLSGVILFEPRDAANNLIAVTPGSAFVELVDAGSNSTVPGQLSAQVSGDTITGLAPQRATIRVRVDAAVSAATEVNIASGIIAGTTFTVNPRSATLSVLRSVTFTATIQNDGPTSAQGVTWSILDNADGSKGTITPTGVFTSTRTEGTFTIRATSVYDPRVFVDTPVTVAQVIRFTPEAIADQTISINARRTFTVTVDTGVPDDDATVSFSIVTPNAVSTINSTTGAFSAGARPETVRVRATSNFRPDRFIEFNVRVVAGNVNIGVG